MIRVLDTHTGQFKELSDSAPLEYAILSHTWDPNGEQTYQEVRRTQGSILSKMQSLVLWAWWHVVPLLVSLSALIRLPGLFAWIEVQLYMALDTIVLSLNTTFPRLHLSPVGPRLLSTRIRRWSRRALHDHSFRDPFLWPAGLSFKIRRACAVARLNGHRYIWIDSCCIDKTSSAELSAAINSMYRWYHRASVCYAYLADFPSDLDGGRFDRQYYEGMFQRSRWFMRGWTLQELIAPKVVVFLNADWQFVGTKASLAERVERATGVDVLVLTGERELREVSVARRLSWASERITTVEEDHAYSLLGIFDINMPTLYGEGTRAFVRLQEEIIKRNPDQSLFAWGPQYSQCLPQPSDPEESRRFSFSYYMTVGPSRPLFASAPGAFANTATFHPVPHDRLAQRLGIPEQDLLPPTYVSTPYGIRTHLPLVSVIHALPQHTLTQPYEDWYLAILACEPSVEGQLVAIICSVAKQSGQLGFNYMNGGNVHIRPHPEMTFGSLHRIVFLSPAQVEACRGKFRVDTVYIPPEDPGTSVHDSSPVLIPDGWTMHLAQWSIITLRQLGYDAAGPYPSESDPASCYYILRSQRGWIRVEFTTAVTNATALHVSVANGPHPYSSSGLPPHPAAAPLPILNHPGEGYDASETSNAPPVENSEHHSTETFTLQHFHEPHVLTIPEFSGHKITLRFTAICLLEPSQTGCLDIQVVRVTRPDTLVSPMLNGTARTSSAVARQVAREPESTAGNASALPLITAGELAV